MRKLSKDPIEGTVFLYASHFWSQLMHSTVHHTVMLLDTRMWFPTVLVVTQTGKWMKAVKLLLSLYCLHTWQLNLDIISVFFWATNNIIVGAK